MFLNLTSTDKEIFSHSTSIPIEVDNYESQKESGIIQFRVKRDYTVYFENDRGECYKKSFKKGNIYEYDADSISKIPEYRLEDTDSFKKLKKEIREHDAAWAKKQHDEVTAYMADKWSF